MSKDEPVSTDWLQSGRRRCNTCHQPLWQQQRMKSGKLRPRLDKVLQRHYRDRIALLIWDEAHEAANADRGNGEAFARVSGLADHTLAMTGTPFNGYASSLFNLEYCMNKRVRQRYPVRGSDRLSRKVGGSPYFPELTETAGFSRGEAEALWVETMGVMEKTLTTSPEFDDESGAFTGTSTYERPYKQAAGIAPALAGELLDHSLFLSLSDFGQALPDYEEALIGVDLDADIDDAYREINGQLKDYLKANRAGPDSTGFNSFMGAYQAWALSWQDMPFLPTTVIHNKRVRGSKQRMPITVATAPLFEADRIYAKEQQLLDLLTQELAAGRPCVVFLRETQKRDLQPRLAQLIGQYVPNAVPFILHSSVDPSKREKVIADQLAQGMNVLISNPELIKTGLDLVEMPTLIFYQPIYNLSTMLQASARAYRLNQTRDCKTIYLYTNGTMEEAAIKLMSRKQRAGKLLVGASGVTGLDSLTEGDGGGLEEALRVMLLNDTTLVDTSTAFAKPVEAEIQLEQADLNYWNTIVPTTTQTTPLPTLPTLDIAQALPAAEAPAATRGDISPASDPLLATILEMGGSVRTEPNKPQSRAEQIPKKIVSAKASAVPKASPQRRKSKPSLLDLPDEPAPIKTPLPIPARPANAPVQLTLF